MLVPQAQQSATMSQSRIDIGAPQSGQAQERTSPLSHNTGWAEAPPVALPTEGPEIAIAKRAQEFGLTCRPAREFAQPDRLLGSLYWPD